jgi:hypothetical protein
MEYWSNGRLRYHVLLLVEFILLNRFDFVLVADLASIPQSSRDPELGQNVSLKSHPQNNKKNHP